MGTPTDLPTSTKDKSENPKDSAQDNRAVWMKELCEKPKSVSKEKDDPTDIHISADKNKTEYDSSEINVKRQNGKFSVRDKTGLNLNERFIYSPTDIVGEDYDAATFLFGYDGKAGSVKHRFNDQSYLIQLSNALEPNNLNKAREKSLPKSVSKEIYADPNGNIAIFKKGIEPIVVTKIQEGKAPVAVNFDGKTYKFDPEANDWDKEGGRDFADSKGNRIGRISKTGLLSIGDDTINLLSGELKTKSEQGQVTVISGNGKSIVDRGKVACISVTDQGVIENSRPGLFKKFDPVSGITESHRGGFKIVRDDIIINDRGRETTIAHNGNVQSLNAQRRLVYGWGETKGLAPGGPFVMNEEDEADDSDGSSTTHHHHHGQTKDMSVKGGYDVSALAALAINATTLENVAFARDMVTKICDAFSNAALQATLNHNLGAFTVYQAHLSEALKATAMLDSKEHLFETDLRKTA